MMADYEDEPLTDAERGGFADDIDEARAADRATGGDRPHAAGQPHSGIREEVAGLFIQCRRHPTAALRAMFDGDSLTLICDSMSCAAVVAEFVIREDA